MWELTRRRESGENIPHGGLASAVALLDARKMHLRNRKEAEHRELKRW